MIDAASAALLHSVETLGDDRAHASDPGYEPINRDLASHSTRTIADTRDPLAVVPPTGTYLVTGGPEGRAYTRNGILQFEGGELRTSDGNPVLGWAPGANANDPPVPLRADPVDAATDRLRNAQIGSDGTVSYERTSVDARGGKVSSERVTLGRVALARLPAGTRVDRVANAEIAPAGEGAVTVAPPGTLGFGELQTHRRELASVDAYKATVRWTEAVQAYYALVEARQHDGTQTAMDLVK